MAGMRWEAEMRGLWVLVVPVLAARLALGVTADVTISRWRVVQGEPVYLRISLANDGDDSATMPCLWQWQSWTMVDGERSSGPLHIEQQVNGRWLGVEPGEWRRQEYSYYHNMGERDRLMVLGPGEQCDVWWSTAWQYELVPGSYRLRPTGLRVLGSDSADRAAAEWMPFTVAAPTGLSAALWEAGAEGRAAVEADRWMDRTRWLPQYREASGTPYGFWGCYARVEARLHDLDSADVWSAMQAGEPVVDDYLAEYSGYPTAERMRLASETIKGITRDVRLDEARWNALVRERLRRLAESNDWEWAWLLARRLAWHDELARRDRSRGVDYLFSAQIEREWRLPWYSLPPDQRPVF